MLNQSIRRSSSAAGATALAILATTLAGCSSHIKTSPTVLTATVEATKNNQSTRVADGQMLTVNLPTQGGSVYAWRLASDSTGSEIVRLRDRHEQRNADGTLAMNHEPAWDAFTFRACDVGTTTLVFVYDCLLANGQTQPTRMTLDVEVYDAKAEARAAAEAQKAAEMAAAAEAQSIATAENESE